MRQFMIHSAPERVEPYLGFGAYLVPTVYISKHMPDGQVTRVNVPDAHAQWLRDRLSSGLIHVDHDEEVLSLIHI